MNNKFDQLTKNVAESVTRRQALKRFGLGLVGMALAGFALSSKADRQGNCVPSGEFCIKRQSQQGFQSCGQCCSKSFACELNSNRTITCFCN